MHINKCSILILLLLILVFPLMAQEDEEVVRDILIGRLQRLKNLIVEYQVTSEYHLPPNINIENAITKSGNKTIVTVTGIRNDSKEFSILGDRVLYDQFTNSWDRKLENPDLDKISFSERTITAFNPDRVELFTKQNNYDAGRGTIRNEGQFPINDIEYALGLRTYMTTSFLTEDNINEMTIDILDDNQVVVTDLDSSKGKRDEWVFDKDHGYALTCYRRYEKIGDEKEKLGVEFKMTDFKNVDGIFLPFVVQGARYNYIDDQRSPAQEDDIKVAKYRLNDEENTPERYHINWPEGTRIGDARSQMSFIAKGDGLVYNLEEKIFEISMEQMLKDEKSNNTESTQETKIKEVSIQSEDEPEDSNIDNITTTDTEESRESFSGNWKWIGAGGIVFIILGTLLIYKRH